MEEGGGGGGREVLGNVVTLILGIYIYLLLLPPLIRAWELEHLILRGLVKRTVLRKCWKTNGIY